MEEWKDVVGYENLYQVSNLGNVRSLDRKDSHNHLRKGVPKKQRKDKDGYYIVTLSKNGVRKDFKVHRLVAIAFIPNTYNYPMINHKDENKGNNCVNNLEWCSPSYNTNYGSRNKKVSGKMKGRKHNYMKGKNNYFYGKHYRYGNNPSSKCIIQYSKTGEKIAEYDSLTRAADSVGVTCSAIGRCCRGKIKTVKDFLWKFG